MPSTKPGQRDAEHVENLGQQYWSKLDKNMGERSFSQGRQEVGQEQNRERGGKGARGRAVAASTGGGRPEESEAWKRWSMEQTARWMEMPVVWVDHCTKGMRDSTSARTSRTGTQLREECSSSR